jgi:hypothetical protein
MVATHGLTTQTPTFTIMAWPIVTTLLAAIILYIALSAGGLPAGI